MVWSLVCVCRCRWFKYSTTSLTRLQKVRSKCRTRLRVHRKNGIAQRVIPTGCRLSTYRYRTERAKKWKSHFRLSSSLLRGYGVQPFFSLCICRAKTNEAFGRLVNWGAFSRMEVKSQKPTRKVDCWCWWFRKHPNEMQSGKSVSSPCSPLSPKVSWMSQIASNLKNS